MNNIVRTITWNKKFSPVTQLYKKLNYLKLNDIYHLELAKFMHKICNNKLPLLFQQRFNKIELVHSHQTIKLTYLNYFYLAFPKLQVKKKLEFRGAKLWNEIQRLMSSSISFQSLAPWNEIDEDIKRFEH